MRVLNRPDWAGDFTMKRTRHTAEQIIRKLKTAEQLIAGAGSTTRSGRTRPSRGERPWRQLNRELQHDHDHPLS